MFISNKITENQVLKLNGTLKIAIFFFSGKGKKWWAARQLAEIFKEKDEKINVELIPIEINRAWNETGSRIFEENDIIGIAFPVHESNVPILVRKWMKQLPVAEGKQVFIFDTMMLFSGDS
ncbi:MAG: hypothetical protein ACXQS8_00315 [Candidatus Helarchaeales archaeon]